MSGEDAWAPEVTGDFRMKCHECGKQIQYEGGQRVVPDCGHETPGVEVYIGGESL